MFKLHTALSLYQPPSKVRVRQLVGIVTVLLTISGDIELKKK